MSISAAMGDTFRSAYREVIVLGFLVRNQEQFWCSLRLLLLEQNVSFRHVALTRTGNIWIFSLADKKELVSNGIGALSSAACSNWPSSTSSCSFSMSSSSSLEVSSSTGERMWPRWTKGSQGMSLSSFILPATKSDTTVMMCLHSSPNSFLILGGVLSHCRHWALLASTSFLQCAKMMVSRP